MKTNIQDVIDFGKVDTLLEGFNKATGFVTAILDLEGNILSKSGWRQICTEFHRIHPETAEKCTISDTVLAGKLAQGEKYHHYKCLNGLVDVAVPIKINGEHIANLFSGQFFFEEPDRMFFRKQASLYGINEKIYLEALDKVPVVSEEKVKTTMDFLLGMTQLISEMGFQKLEQTELNKTIRESEEKFKAVFESANVGKSITLPTGEINVNQAFCDMLGYTREELRNKKWQDLTPENEIPTIQAFTNPLLKGEKDSARFEKRYICKNGSYIWADVSVSLQRDEDGRPIHYITTVIDITERKQTNKYLIESESRYRALFENMNTGFEMFEVVQNEQGIPVDLIIIAANEGFEKTTGLKLRDSIGKRLTQVLPGIEKDDADWIGTFSKVALTGEAIQFEQDSKLLGRCYSISAFQPGPKQCAVTFVDITERKKLEFELQKYFMLAESSSEFIGMCDLNLQPIYVNPSGVRMVGLPDLAEACRVKVQDYFFPEDQRFIAEEFFPRVMREGEGDVEIRLRNFKTGAPIWMLYYLFRVCDSNGIPVGWATVSRDITERKQSENKLRESESRFRKLYEDGAIGMVMAGKDFKFLMANRTFCQMTGYEEKELQKLTFAQITHPDDMSKDIPPAYKMMAGEIDVYRTEKRYKKKDGETFWAQLTVSPIYDSS
ncbi:MAG: PAS domain S-box protein, partial [Bacteroidota bacterium]